MFVSNYWNYIVTSQKISTTYPANPGPLCISYGCIGTDGNPAKVTYGGYKDGSTTSEIVADINLRPYSYLTLGIGSGTTSPSFHDYSLANDLSSSFQHLNSKCIVGADIDCLKIVGTVSGVNVSGSDVTIREVGLFKGYSTSVNTGYTVLTTPDAKLLYARILLDEPLTVKHLEGFSKTFEFVAK